ncbi:hypothetical protein ACFWF7_31770 [Nocardia sp. NPDC060256]|uniref:hypothetical protein n=1 Tax=unclassified Nocardia TaxID=2637762 RepID=UPI003658202E
MRQPPTPKYVVILETTVLIMIAVGLVLARLSFKVSGGVTNCLYIGAILAGLAALGAYYSARRARAELEPPDPDDP